MTIKKAYVEVVDFLEANEGAKVKTILDAVREMCSAKSGGGASGGSTYIKDANGQVTHVFCYYHQKWEDVSAVEYGAKASSATGLNNMCKEGVSEWTKAVREAKKASEELLTKVASGEVAPTDIPAEQEKIELIRKTIKPREDGHGLDEAPTANAA